MSVKIACPWCGQHYELNEYVEGASIVCKVCGKEVTVSKELVDAFESMEQLRNEEQSNDKTKVIDQKIMKPMKKTETEPNICTCFKVVSIVCVVWVFVRTICILMMIKGGARIGPISIEMDIAVWMTRALLFWGCSKLLYYISVIRKNAIRQTELLERLVDRKH